MLSLTGLLDSALLSVATQYWDDTFLLLLDLVTIAGGGGGKEELWKLPSSQCLLAEKLSSALTFTILHIWSSNSHFSYGFHFSFFCFIANSLLQCFNTYFTFRAVRLPQRADRHLLRKLNVFTSVIVSPETVYSSGSRSLQPAGWKLPWPSPETAKMEQERTDVAAFLSLVSFPSAHLALS